MVVALVIRRLRTPTETLRGGYYACGANELHILHALDKVLDYLESEHGLNIE